MKPDYSKYLLSRDNLDPWEKLSRSRLKKAIAIRDYMLGEGRLNPDANDTLTVLSEKLVDAGLPLHRCVTIVRILHAINTASYRVWEDGIGAQGNVFAHSPGASTAYDQSPSALAHESKQWVRFNPQTIPDEVFNITPELRQAGITDYVCAPTFMANGMQNIFSFATRSASGFADEDIAMLVATFPAIEACQEILVMHRILKEVTRMYVGEEPHERILAGDVHRGEVTRLQSAILFSDMRGFTRLTADLPAEEATALLNDYYDCVVPAIETNGGEVLKFIGDGILAIFRADEDHVKACKNALSAAQASLKAVDAHKSTTSLPFDVGIALHAGEVAYGNVGSGVRLDYTVIGRDVNLAARVADLCGTLGKSLLLSKDFCGHIPAVEVEHCGTHPLKGLNGDVDIFTL